MADYTAFVEAGTALTELIRDQLTPGAHQQPGADLPVLPP